MKTLLITNCTGKKSSEKGRIPARKRYEGKSVQAVKLECEREGYDLGLISAELGYIHPYSLVPKYDTVFKGSVLSKNEIKHNGVVYPNDKKIRAKIIPRLKKELLNYDEIILFLPEHYIRAAEPVLNEFLNKIRVRKYMRRHLNNQFLNHVLKGKKSIRPEKPYEDVLGSPVKCKKCGNEIKEKLVFHLGEMYHRSCNTKA